MDIDGKKVAEELQEELRQFLEGVDGRRPSLAVVLVGDNPASQLYVNGKVKACERVGIESVKYCLEGDCSEEELLFLVDSLNRSEAIDGILVQLPLPPHIDSQTLIERISWEKDVDGFHPLNLGKLMIGDSSGFVPCTPLGVQVLLQKYGVETAGKRAVVVGRSLIVGKPMAELLLQKGSLGDATVTVLHSRSEHFEEICRDADILIAAVGKAHLITRDMVKEGAVVIDVGQNRIEAPDRKSGYRIVGDVDYDAVAGKCRLITPVPGGVGPMTIAMLLHNTIKSYCLREKIAFSIANSIVR